MSRCWLLTLVLTACVASNESTTTQNLIGGEVANPADFPTVVGLEDGPTNWFCTGTLIDPKWVLTAAHCMADETAAKLHVRFDDPDVNTADGGKVVTVASIHVDPEYNDVDWDNDVALIELTEAVTDRAPTPIHREQIMPGTMVQLVGYGDSDNTTNGNGGQLRKVSKVTAACTGANDPTVLDANLLCMDDNDGRGSCYGDSGGPMFTTINGTTVVVGITSGGTDDLCGKGWDLYTSVFAELAFIDSAMSMPTPPPDPMPMPPDGDGKSKDDDGGGCNSGGSSTAGIGLLLALLLWRRAMRR